MKDEQNKLLEKNLMKLEEIVNYKKNWNNYDAEPINKAVIARVKCILNILPYPPEIVPTAQECIQLEYNNDDEGKYLELVIYEDDIEGYIKAEDMVNLEIIESDFNLEDLNTLKTIVIDYFNDNFDFLEENEDVYVTSLLRKMM